MGHIHNLGIVHRDIKPENILIDNEGIIKVADFGVSVFDKNIDQKQSDYTGTLQYMAPE